MAIETGDGAFLRRVVEKLPITQLDKIAPLDVSGCSPLLRRAIEVNRAENAGFLLESAIIDEMRKGYQPPIREKAGQALMPGGRV